MTPKKNRLTKEDIDNKLRNARKIEGDIFRILYTIDKGAVVPQVSLVAPKKIANTAVARNKLRRRAYSAIKPLISMLLPGTKAVIHYKKQDSNIPIGQIRDDIEGLFGKAGLIK